MTTSFLAGTWIGLSSRGLDMRSHRRRRSVRRAALALESLEGRTLMASGLAEFSGPFSVPVDILTGPDGNLWVLNSGSRGASTITVIAPDLTIKGNYTIPTSNASASAITVGPDGNLWFVEEAASKIGKVTPAGDITEYPIPNTLEDVGFASGPLEVSATPTSLVTGPDGAIWFTESSTHSIGRITTDGVLSRVSTPGLQPGSITVGPDHAIWFTDTSYHDSIDRLNADGSVTTFALPSTFAMPTSLTAGPDGALWFVESFNQAVGRITMDGAVTEMPIRAGVQTPQRLTFDSAGNIWVTGSGSGLVRITPDGFTTDVGLQSGAIGSILGVTTGPDGAIWFTDTSRDQVGRFDPSTLTVSPSDHPLSKASQPGLLGSPVNQLQISGDIAAFNDGNPAGAASDFTASINWGDGSTTTGAVHSISVGVFEVSGEHDYAQAGVVPITVTITDVNPSHTPQPNTLTWTTSVFVWDPSNVPPPTPQPLPVVIGPPVMPIALTVPPPTAPTSKPLTAVPMSDLGLATAIVRTNLFRAAMARTHHVAAHHPAPRPHHSPPAPAHPKASRLVGRHR
jgi:virginiamycin B lyase